ncbi:MAG: Gldg family protein [Ruminococcus sp.]|nr:Gldg family protein [Ruminococcus sp.]
MKNKKFNLTTAIAILIAVLVLIVFIPINIIAGYYDKVFDMTPAKKYTLNAKTEQLLSDTSDKHIDVYYLSKLEYFKDAPEFLALYHTLTQLDERENITLTCFEPDENAALARELDPDGLLGVQNGDIFVKCGDIVKRIDHNKIFQTSADGTFQYAGEELVAAAIETCTSGSLPTIYFLKGHGEKSISENYDIYANQLKANNYAVAELDLTETKAVPGNARIIYLAGPQQDISDEEKDLLKGYLTAGGSMSMLLSPSGTKGRFDNIEEILGDYGIIMDYNVVTESSAANQLQDRDSVQNENFMRVEYPEATGDYTEDLTTDINYLVSNESYSAGISGTRSFALMSETSFANAANVEVSPLIRNVAGSDGNYTTVSTPMGGDDVTEKEAQKISGMQLDYGYYALDRVTGAKLIVMGSTDIIDRDTVAPSMSGTTMLLTFTNTWLYDSDVSMGIGNKLDAYDSMTFEDASHAKTVLASLIIIPIALALFGTIVWLKRRHS